MVEETWRRGDGGRRGEAENRGEKLVRREKAYEEVRDREGKWKKRGEEARIGGREIEKKGWRGKKREERGQ